MIALAVSVVALPESADRVGRRLDLPAWSPARRRSSRSPSP